MEICIAAGPITNQKEKAFISPGSTTAAGFSAINMKDHKGQPIETTNTKPIIDCRINLFFLKVLKSFDAIVQAFDNLILFPQQFLDKFPLSRDWVRRQTEHDPRQLTEYL